MHFRNKCAVVLISCFISALVFLVPPAIHGDEWNLATRFTVNQPFEVPGMVLQPNTRYVIRLHDSPSVRNVVQIYNDDESKMLTMFMGISDERLQPADKTVFTFIETQPGFPLPVREWFYPGRPNGLEFVYPKDQAMEIARHAREAVLATNTTNLHSLNSVTIEAIGPLGTEAPVAASAANITKEENTTVFEEKPSVTEPAAPAEAAPAEPESAAIAQENQENEQNLKTETEVQREKPIEEPQSASAPGAEEINRELPRTAGELPLIALIGVLCLGAGLGLKVISSRS